MGFAKSRIDVEPFSIKDRSSRGGIFFVANLPQVFACKGIVGNGGLGGSTHHLNAGRGRDEDGGRVGFVDVSVIGPIFDLAVDLPYRLAVALSNATKYL